MVVMNPFRVLGDLSHLASKCVLIWAIHSNRSAEGVSLVTQILYVAVFVTRYLDLFWVRPSASYWNFTLKNIYIWTSIYIIILMTRVFARTREREKSWKLGGLAAGGSLLAAPLITLIFEGARRTSFNEVLYTFSLILESVCVLPQLLLLRQTTVPTVIDSFYLVLLGSYRAWYIINWIDRLYTERHFDPINFIFGVVQTALYVDFAWVYYTRQRVKLRGGGVVDSDDLRKGWLVSRVLGGQRNSMDEERPAHDNEDRDGEEAAGTKTNRWGARGISVSADDTLHDHQYQHRSAGRPRHEEGTADERQTIFTDDGSLLSDDEDAPSLDSPANRTVLNSDEAWNDSPQQK